MNNPQHIAFGALVRSKTTRLAGHFVATTFREQHGYAHHLIDERQGLPGNDTYGCITIIFRDELEVLRAEPTADDIAATNAGLAAYTYRQCAIKVGDQVNYHYHGRDENNNIVPIPTPCTVTKVMPVFNSHMPNSFRITATFPPGSKYESLEADQGFFTPITNAI